MGRFGTRRRPGEALKDSRCQAAFNQDCEALQRADACILLLPSGRSAHLEAGWCMGQGKPTAVYAPEPIEPELMYLLASHILTT